MGLFDFKYKKMIRHYYDIVISRDEFNLEPFDQMLNSLNQYYEEIGYIKEEVQFQIDYIKQGEETFEELSSQSRSESVKKGAFYVIAMKGFTKRFASINGREGDVSYMRFIMNWNKRQIQKAAKKEKLINDLYDKYFPALV